MEGAATLHVTETLICGNDLYVTTTWGVEEWRNTFRVTDKWLSWSD